MGFSRKRLVSTRMSVASRTTSASAMSLSESAFLVPAEPCVSTLILCPSNSAAFLSASAAMSVCAMPVGQDVTATIIFMGGYSLERLTFHKFARSLKLRFASERCERNLLNDLRAFSGLRLTKWQPEYCDLGMPFWFWRLRIGTGHLR